MPPVYLFRIIIAHNARTREGDYVDVVVDVVMEGILAVLISF